MGPLLRLFRRRNQFRAITPEELHQRLERGELITVVDLRHPLDFLPDPRLIPGAMRIPPDELAVRHVEIPRQRQVVLYGTCPSDAAREDLVARFTAYGITRITFLFGGLPAWRDRGYPLVERVWDAHAKAKGAA